MKSNGYVYIHSDQLTSPANWAKHSSRTRDEMISDYTEIRRGIIVNEFHKVDSIEGNRVYLTSPVTSPLDSKFKISNKDMTVGFGAEDLHIDLGLDETYRHLVQNGRTGFRLQNTGDSWVRRVRFSNCINGIAIGESCNISVIGIIFDGKFGHHPISASAAATHCFIGLVEDHTDKGMHHGLTVAHKASGNVLWRIGGPNMKGPDPHGTMPRHNLFDLY